jgi:hypothetical protein
MDGTHNQKRLGTLEETHDTNSSGFSPAAAVREASQQVPLKI